MFRVDGSLYGDTKLYYSTDVLKTHAWGNDAEAANLLALDRPDAPFCQAIVLDQFRQIRLTVDNYLSKRAWSTEGAFSEFTSVMLGWLRDTKKVYDATLINSFVGETSSTIGKQTINVTLPTDTDAEAQNRLQAQTIAKTIADTLVELKDISRDYNDLGYLRSYDNSDLVMVWNSAEKNKITKMDEPTIFHKDGLFEDIKEVVLPERYFSAPVSASVTVASVTATNAPVYYANEEMDLVYGTGSNERTVHLFPGDKVNKITSSLHSISNVALQTVTVDGTTTATTTFPADSLRTMPTDTTTVCKIIHKDSVPFMSAFEVQGSFFNPRSLTESNFLTYAHNTLQYLKDKPFVTINAQ